MSGLPFPSRGSSRPRDAIGMSCISCIDRQILYHRATWGAHEERLKTGSFVIVSVFSGDGILQKLGSITELTHSRLRS